MYAIIGSTSKIGRELVKELGGKAIGFSRHEPAMSEKYFDLNKIEQFNIKKSQFKKAIICAGMTNIADCEANATLSFEINCLKMVGLIKQLNKIGIPVTILSSSSVFGEYEIPPPEDHKRFSPTCRYALHKSLVDDYVINAWEKNTIIRLTKVIDDSGIFLEIIKKIKEGGSLKLYENLRFSPISLKFTISSVKKILLSDSCGVFHISGEKTFSYVDYVQALLKFYPISSAKNFLIEPIIARNTIYMPLNGSLSMEKTSQKVSIFPQSIESSARDFFGQFNNID